MENLTEPPMPEPPYQLNQPNYKKNSFSNPIFLTIISFIIILIFILLVNINTEKNYDKDQKGSFLEAKPGVSDCTTEWACSNWTKCINKTMNRNCSIEKLCKTDNSTPDIKTSCSI